MQAATTIRVTIHPARARLAAALPTQAPIRAATNQPGGDDRESARRRRGHRPRQLLGIVEVRSGGGG